MTVVVFLRWNPYLGRYFVPASVLGILVIGILFKAGDKIVTILTLISTLSFIYALPFALMSQNRPLMGKNSIFSNSSNEQRFVSRPDLLRDFDKLETVIRETKPTSIEIAVRGNDWEYPIWGLANRIGLRVYDYRDSEQLKGNSPLLICYESCLDAKPRKLTYILQKPLPSTFLENQIIKFTAANPKVLKSGWSSPEEWGVWSQEDNATIEFNISKTFLRSQSIILTLRSWKIDSPKSRNMEVVVNEKKFASMEINKIGANYQMKIPNLFLSSLPISNKLTIKFSFKNLVSPSELNLGMDRRKLGIGLYQIRSLDSK
jgi:hypothetical protein